MMIFKKGMVWGTVVLCLSAIADRNMAIVPDDGTRFGVNGTDVAPHYLTEPGLGIIGSALSVVAGSADVTMPGDPPSQISGAYSSGTFTDGLAGGPAELIGEIPPPPIQTVGGIGIDKGVCLSTGRVEDRDPTELNRRFGANGPNDALPEDEHGTFDGSTVSKYFDIDEQIPIGDDDYGDPDLAESADVNHIYTADRCALEFNVTTAVTAYIQLRVVFASDEYLEWLAADIEGDSSGVFDDQFGVFICPAGENFDGESDNIAVFRHADFPVTRDMPFSIYECRLNEQLYTENQSVPSNDDFQPGAQFYNHEYDFFTKKLLIESRQVYPPGQYRVKIVIHDAGRIGPPGGSSQPDDYVDSALFIEGDSFKLNTAPLIDSDYNANASVEQGDLDLVLLNWGDPANPPPAGWIHDLPAGSIDQAELDGVLLN